MTSVLVVAPLAVVLADDTLRKWFGASLAVRARPSRSPKAAPTVAVSQPAESMMLLFIGTHSVTTTLNVHSRSRSFVGAIDLRGLAPSVRLFRRPNTNGMKK